MKITLAEKPYFAIQGEGKNIGKPLIIIRLSGCNLRCDWCDSKYTWQEQKNSLTFEIDEFIKYLDQFNQKNNKHLLFTGGEPTLQKKALNILLKKLKNEYTFEIETNGVIEVSQNFLKLFSQYNVSLKLENSKNQNINCLNQKSIHKLVLAKNTIFKFVVSSKSDLEKIQAIQKKYQIPSEKIYLMPEGVTEKEIQNKAKMIIPYCLDFHYNFSTRLHILVYGNQRGV